MTTITHEDLKQCAKCGEWLPLSDFRQFKRYGAKNKRVAICTPCIQKKRKMTTSDTTQRVVYPDPNRRIGNLSNDTVRAIREDYRRGNTIPRIRGEYGLHRTIVVDIINRRSYANVED